MFGSSKARHGLAASLVIAQLGLTVRTAHAEAADALSLTGRPGGLMADHVVQRATATSLAAEEKQHEVAAARAQLEKAVLDYLPRLSGTASYTRLSPVPDRAIGTVVFAPGAERGPLAPSQPLVAAPLSVQNLENSTSFSATLMVPLTDYVFRLVQAHEGAKAQLAASERSLEATRRKAAYDARALYYEWVRSELDAEVARQDLELGREHLARVKSLATADSASEADVARVEATVAASELVLVQARNYAALMQERCRIAMHDEGKEPYEIGEDLHHAPEGPAPIDDMNALVRAAQEARPELSALSAQVRVYEQQAKVARGQSLPRLDFSAQSVTANPNQRYFPQEDEFHSTWSMGVQLSYSPNDLLAGGKSAAAARAKARAHDAQRRALLDAVRSEVVEAVLSHRNAMASIDASARRLTAAETSYEARRARFVADMATTVELTEAQTELFRARLDAVQAQVAIRLARARIAYATGQEI